MLIPVLCHPTAELDKERTSLENVPSNYIESVCMPDFDEFFQQAGGAGYPLPEHKVTPVMNGNSGPSSSGASSSASGSFIDGKSGVGDSKPIDLILDSIHCH